MKDVLICFCSLSGRADMDTTDKAEPLSEHQPSLLAQPQANGDNTDFLSIRTSAQPVSYFNWFSPNAPHPQDHNVSWQFLYRPVPKKYPGIGLQPN